MRLHYINLEITSRLDWLKNTALCKDDLYFHVS